MALRNRHAFLAPTIALAGALAVGTFTGSARAQEPAACLSPDPAQWPASSKPYFMILIDTSGSMITTVAGAAPSCGYPTSRMGHAKCAVKNTVLAFGGEVNFGLAQFASIMTGCGANCYGNASNVPNPGCDVGCYNAEINQFGTCSGCGPMDNIANPATARGGRVLVGMQVDNHWSSPPNPTNLPQILQYVDNNCSSNLEVVNTPTDGLAYGLTPLNGSLRDMKRYFQTGWTNPDNAAETYPTPLNANDRACRSVNVILLTDGDETCDSQQDAVNAATDLFQNGVVVGGKTFKIKVHVINFAGGSVANTDAIAAAGGTGTSKFATNEVQLSQALSNIISGSVSPETCDNVDNNCNGCTDEGYTHYCNQGKTAKTAATNVTFTINDCCAGVTIGGANGYPAGTTCQSLYLGSINAANPQGNLGYLKCTTQAQQSQPANWLCYDPKEICDNVDNNCQAGVDETIVKCGSPLACPTAEVCNGKDDDCDGLSDEGLINCGCVPSPEICDGCDNDCDGIADDGIAPLPCGLASPPNCSGSLTCKPPVAVPVGTCVAGGGYNACSNNPQSEVCDGVDNDCDGTPDDGIAPTACVPAGTPPGLVYGGTSQCQQGTKPCNGACTGFVGPSSEICDGIDNDCDGQVDEGAFGVGVPCGVNQPPCTTGITACVAGALVCQGGVGPQPEVCDGADNDCDGAVDEAPLADAPAPGQNGCWADAGNCCVFANLSWCPPAGATCTGVGALTAPCNKGTLACEGGSWACKNPKGPVPEVCDGLDNNCNGTIDDNVSQVGTACGSDVGECSPGTLACTAGVLDCVGDVPPTPEVCDGLDNDCDGTNDNGISVGGTCTVPYDTSLYPGPRDNPPCQPGILQCDGMGGQVCFGGVGPSPEVCDGIDNDCDGTIDEVGTAPDGIDASANPFPPPAASIGDACGSNVGECKEGAYACVNGQFACLGGQGPAPTEECDCKDNNCNGTTDEEMPPICGSGKSCVSSNGTCQCAAPCGTGEVPCPGGQKCETVTSSETGQVLGKFCVTDFDALCGDCGTKTVVDANQTVLCAPAGTELANCFHPPVCVCKGQNGCQEPCFNVTCDPGLACTGWGPNAGSCVVDNCWNFPCQGCGKACNLGSCVDNPCQADSCAPGEVCKPSADFTTFTCVGSCAGVTCPAGQACVGGECQPSCDPPCGAGQVCDDAQTPPACVPDQCTSAPCTDGSCCDPATGQCGNCPCEGVLCPSGQQCADGECVDQGGTGGGGGASSTSSSGATSTSSSSGTGPGAGGAGSDRSIWGLPTGGGGCACEVGAGAERRGADPRWLVVALALGLVRRRRHRRSSPSAIRVRGRSSPSAIRVRGRSSQGVGR